MLVEERLFLINDEDVVDWIGLGLDWIGLDWTRFDSI